MRPAKWPRHALGLTIAAALLSTGGLSGGALAQDAASGILVPDVPVFLEAVKKHKDVEEATLDTSDKEYPFIKVRDKGGSTFFLDFEDCDENAKDCHDLWVSASWDRTDVDLSRLNEWNRSALSYAYLNKSGKPVLSHYVVLDGGIVATNFAAIVSTFIGEIGLFAKHIAPGTAQQN